VCPGDAKYGVRTAAVAVTPGSGTGLGVRFAVGEKDGFAAGAVMCGEQDINGRGYLILLPVLKQQDRQRT
jgi:hypothetical protein